MVPERVVVAVPLWVKLPPARLLERVMFAEFVAVNPLVAVRVPVPVSDPLPKVTDPKVSL